MPTPALSAFTAAVAGTATATTALVPRDLLQVLGAVADPRKARGVRHSFPSILAVAVCAVLAGARSFTAIAEWGADLPPGARLRLGLGRRVISEPTMRRALCAVDAEALSIALCRWVASRCAPPGHGPRVIAIDGKSARGARGVDGRAVHLLAALDVTTGAVLGQVQVNGKHNEITAFPLLLKGIDITGALISADAMHTQRAHVEFLHTRGAHWLLIVKGNHPKLHAQLRALPWRDVPIAHLETDKGHGRTEKRTLKVAAVGAGIGFLHAALAIKLLRTRQPRGAPRTTETIYAITDLSWHQIHPAQIAEVMRAHWHIENRLHWVRDVTFAEDHSQIRTGHGPAAMATLRNLAISLHRLHGATNIAEACRHVSRHPGRALRLIT